MFQLSFDTDNAAFEERPELETVRILRALADQIWASWGPDQTKFQNVRDVNGNTIGTWKLAPEEQR